MVVNPNSFRAGYFEAMDAPFERPTFLETLTANFGYTYDPVYESIRNYNKFGNVRQSGYNPLEDLGEYYEYATHLRSAVSPEHMIELKRGINESLDRRRVLGQSSFISQLGAGLFDPLNLVALPLGGPTIGLGRSALRVGVGTAALQAGIETTLIQPFDPVQSASESAMNVAGAFLFGGAMGGLVSIPITKRAQAYEKIVDSLNKQSEVLRQVEYMSELTADDFSMLNSPDARVLSDLSPNDLANKITELSEAQSKLKEKSNAVEEGKRNPFTEELEILNDDLSLHKREHAMRRLEINNFNPEQMWSMADNFFTESLFYKFVSTPFKRVIQSNKATASVKEAVVRLAGDAGINLTLNTFGIASPLSVHQRAAARNGDWVKAHDGLIKLFREDMNLADTSRLDIDPNIAWRSLRNRDDSYSNWLKRINEKRTKKVTDLTDLEKKSIKIIDDFFKKAERELNDVGLIGSKKSMTDELRRVNRELADLEDALAKPLKDKKFIRLREEDMKRKSYLDKRKGELESSIKAFDDTTQSLETTDNFLPRFWDMGAIKKNRAKFERILTDWYNENPTIWKFEKGEWKKTYLKTDGESVSARVNETIDTILGETNPTDEANIGFGYGRSKHFRHRQVDIPNELVWEFIVQDPIAIMKTYTARVAPRLEFRKQFGGDLDDVLFKLRRDMLSKNMSDAQINKDLRDFRILYDRVAGAVLDNPSALNQKIAYIMKEAAATNYMGGAWAAAIPEFGRIVMEHDGSVIIKATQGMLDKEVLKMSGQEVRWAGEAVDIVKGSAHVRLVDDMANNVDANEIWNKTRNAFYVLNGLAPVTQISKMLDGMARGHTIIERAVKLSKGEATEFEKVWLARNGISEELALKIAKAPWQKSKNGLIVANTEEWTDSFSIPEIDGKRVNVIEANEDGSPVGTTSKGRYVPARYNKKSNTIFFDREYIEGKHFEDKAWLNPRMEGVKALPDIFNTPKDWANFVMLHEVMHTRFSAKDLGFEKTSKVFPKGFSREEIVNDLNSSERIEPNMDLAFHVTNSPDAIIKDGFQQGGMMVGHPHHDYGYGEYIAVFDLRKAKKKFKVSNKEDLTTRFRGRGQEPVHSSDFASRLYGDAAFALDGEKPIAIIHVNEVPNLKVARQGGARAEEQGVTGSEAIEEDFYNKLEYAYLTGKSREEIESISGFDFFMGDYDFALKSLKRLDEVKLYKDYKSPIKPKSVKKINVAEYENAINDMALKEWKKQSAIQQDVVNEFRAALNTGVLNTILSATPADRPIINDGVAFVPYRIAKRFGYKEDKRYKGYSRIENGFMALPFQFYSYTLANVNKMVGGMAHGQMKNRAIGVTAMLGLGYLSVKAKTPDYVWEEMDWRDRFARSYDASGVTALYSDLFYTSMHTSLALGGPNITNGYLSPKYPQGPSIADAATGLAGAGPSITYDIAMGAAEFASGDYGEGAKNVFRNLPFTRMWFWKDEMNQMTRAWSQ